MATSQPLTVIVYEDQSMIRDKIYARIGSPVGGAGVFRIPLYIVSPDTILFNGGLGRFNLAVDIANSLQANLDIYSLERTAYDKLDKSNVRGVVTPFIDSQMEDGESSEEESEDEGESSEEESEDEGESSEEEGDEEEQGKVGKKRKLTEKQAEAMVSWFEVSITGARDDEILVGVSKGTVKTLIKLHGPTVKPRAKDINALRDFPQVWKKFLTKLGSIAFFKDKSLAERERWLLKNATEKDLYVGEESDDQWIELIQPGDGLLVGENVNASDLERLMEGNPDHPQGWWKQEDIIEIIPAKPGSRARRHTLFFNKSFWRVASDYKVVESFDGVVFDVFGGEIQPEARATKGMKLLVVDDVTSEVAKGKGTKKVLTTAGGRKTGEKWVRSETQSVGFLIDEEQMVINWANVTDLIVEILEELKYDTKSMRSTLDLIRANFKEYTAASYKSLMQKLIRFRASQVQLMPEIQGGGLVDARVVLLMTMGALVINPGSFVPDIQRYVTGLESFAKRLGVIICEDSSTEDPRELQSLFSGALLAQRVRTWRPSRRQLRAWFLVGIEAWGRKYKYDFKIEEGLTLPPFVVSAGNTPLENVSALIDELRSFGGDIGMIRYIAARYDKATGHWDQCAKLKE